MKVVLFCGGLGTRLRDYDDSVPKPMVTIGYRPIMWHLMKYYAHYGHKDFVLCLGYKADVIKKYFLEYNECLSNDFVLAEGGQRLDLLNTDIHDWRMTFVDTGPRAPIGERLRRVHEHVADRADGRRRLAQQRDGHARLAGHVEGRERQPSRRRRLLRLGRG